MRFLAFLLFLPFAASAADCEPVANLWEKRGLSEPLTQEKTSWCFAHAAANLLAVKTGRPVDAQVMARDFHRSERSQRMDTIFDAQTGGWVSKALSLAYAKGVCQQGLPCRRVLPRGGVGKELLVTDGPQGLRNLDLLLGKGEPVALSIDLSFFREEGSFRHSVVVVGREVGPAGCEYLAVDSNRSTTGWKPEYANRLENGFLRLTAAELEAHAERLDFIRGEVSLPELNARVPAAKKSSQTPRSLGPAK